MQPIEIHRQKRTAYVIKKIEDDLDVEAESKSKPKIVNQDSSQSYIAQCLARLVRYRRGTIHSDGLRLFNDMLEELAPQGPKIHIYMDRYFVIHNVRQVSIYQWKNDESGSLDYELLLHKDYDEIECLDLIETQMGWACQDSQGRGLSIAVVTINRNQIYSLHYNSHKIDLNEKIYAVTFVQGGTLLVHLQRQVMLYTIDTNGQFVCQKQLTKPKQAIFPDQFLSSKDTFTKYHRGKIYVAYLVRKHQCSQGPCNLVLDIIEIKSDYSIQFRTRILEFYQKAEDQRIQDFVLLENQVDTSFLLILHKQAILVKMKALDQPKIECPHEWDDSQNIFAIIPHQIQKTQTSEDRQDLVMLVKYCKSFQSSKKEIEKSKDTDGKIILLNIQTYQNHIKKQQFQTSLRDIMIINKDLYQDPDRRLIKCCVVDRKMIFFFFYTKPDQTKHVIQIFFSQAIKPFDKLKQLLPQKLPHKRTDNLTEASADLSNNKLEQKKPNQSFIPKQDLKLLLILNETYKESNTNSKNLYMCVWQKIKYLMERDGDDSNIEAYTSYLYKTCDLKYVKNQLTELREKRGVKKNSFFRKHYIAVKKMAKEKLEQGQGNRDQNFKAYLKSTFLLKKLSLNYGSNDVDIKPKDFNNWKKRDIRVTFYDDIKARMKPQIRQFINLFKSYFIEHYEDIIQTVLNSEMGKTQSSLLDNKQILYVLLPHYISEKTQGDDPNYQKLAFEVSGLAEETCFQDLKFNTSKYTEADLMKCKNQLSFKYMRSNDFLFKSRKELIEKQNDLVNNHQAVYTFLSIINKKQEQKVDGKERDECFIDFLAQGNFINLKLRLRLSLYTKLFKLYKQHIDPKINMKDFLPISEAQIYLNVIFNSEDEQQTRKRIIFMLNQVVMVWSHINKSVDKHLQAEDSRPLYSIDPDDTPTFETFLPQCFELAAQRYTDKEILSKLKIFLSVLSEIQDKTIGDRQLTIEKILLIVFKYLRTDYIDQTIEMFQLVNQLTINVEIPELMKKQQDSEQQINEQLKKTFRIIRDNIDFFKQFDIKETFSTIENRDQNEIVTINQNVIRQFFQNYLKIKPRQVVFEGESYNIQRLGVLLDLILNFTSIFYRADRMYNVSEDRSQDWRMIVFGIFLDVMLNADLERTTQRPLLDEITDIVERQDSAMKTSDAMYDKRAMFHQKLRGIIVKAKEKQNDNKDKKGSNNAISQFISKCLDTLKKGTQAGSFVKQEELMQKMQQARYDIKDLQKIHHQKQQIIEDISKSMPKHMGRHKHQVQENLENAAKIQELFNLSVSKKCDDYIIQRVQKKPTTQDVINIIEQLQNAAELFQPLFLILKSMQKSKIELSIKQSKEKQKQSKQKSQQKYNKDIVKVRYEALYRYIRTVHRTLELIRFIQQNWDQLLCETVTTDKVKLPSDNYPCDVQMYYYVPEFLHEPKYYVFVQLMYADYERAMKYYLRYRGSKQQIRLDLNFAKIMQLIKIFLKKNKEKHVRNLEMTLQMLIARFKGNVYVSNWIPARQIKGFIDKVDKATIENDNKLVFGEIEGIYNLYQQYVKPEKEEVSRNEQQQKNTTQAQLGNGIEIHSSTKSHNNLNERKKTHNLTQNTFFDEIQTVFQQGKTRQFIQLVETFMEKKEETHKKANQFNMYYFRLFTRCVKFDEKLIRLFDFELFYQDKMDYKENDEDGINDANLLSKFRKYLRPNIQREINSDNYIQIAKAIRFGFNNCAQLEFQIIMIYLSRLIEQHAKYVKQNYRKMQFNSKQEELDLEKSIKLVLDNIDSQTLKEEKKKRKCAEAGMTEQQISKLIDRRQI